MGAWLQHFQFLDATHNVNLALAGGYNYLLVALSILVACIASYSALKIVGRIHAAPTSLYKTLWVITGACTMGIGVWAMHFVGMLAFILPVPVSYDPLITLLSMVPSILASGVMLRIISRAKVSYLQLLLGGALMGAGIGLMHYVGMEAMRTSAIMFYDPKLFVASVVVAVVLATIALHFALAAEGKQASRQPWKHIGAAFIMGLAVSGMHYTGMAAAYFFPGDGVNAHGTHLVANAIDPLWLAAWVTAISILIIGITVFVSMLDNRLEIARKYGAQLEILVAKRTEELQETNQQLQVELEQRRQAQEALRLAKEAAEAATQAKAEFLANMSHEIRTPLNAIVGMTDLLMDTPLVDEQRDFMDTIRTSSDSLLGVINDILDFSKIEAHKMELEAQPFDLHKCVEEALDMMVVKASEKRLELAYLADPDVPATIFGDITRLRQILINLMNNAIKFTEAGEVVVMVASTAIPAPHAANTDQEETLMPWCELHFSVRDTGIGIPPDRMDRLFQSFSQVDTSTTRKYGGTGLGLIISQRLCELMDGRMWVESDGAGHGSTFHFTIKAQIVADQLPADPLVVNSLLHNKRGLVVDDNAVNRLIITRQIETWSMHSQAAASGMEALQWLADGERYDFAILDLCMPEMDGFDLARKLRQHPNGATLPLIMLSSLGDKFIHSEAETLNFAAVLAKPVKQAQLGKMLLSILGQDKTVSLPAKPISSFDPSLAGRLPLRILLAEDNVVNQKVAQHILARLGYTLQIVNNGREAVQEVLRQRYDVVLMDVQMPELDGMEATRQIIAQCPAEQRPYIIAMTAHALTGDADRCIAAGMNGYVSKPIQIENLVAALQASRVSPPIAQPA